MDTNTILKLSPKERYTLLKDDSYRKYLFEEKNHYQFIWLVQGLKDVEILKHVTSLIPLLATCNQYITNNSHRFYLLAR